MLLLWSSGADVLRQYLENGFVIPLSYGPLHRPPQAISSLLYANVFSVSIQHAMSAPIHFPRYLEGLRIRSSRSASRSFKTICRRRCLTTFAIEVGSNQVCLASRKSVRQKRCSRLIRWCLRSASWARRLCHRFLGVSRKLSGEGQEMIGNLLVGLLFRFLTIGESLKMPRYGSHGPDGVG